VKTNSIAQRWELWHGEVHQSRAETDAAGSHVSKHFQRWTSSNIHHMTGGVWKDDHTEAIDGNV
jgi:hypothetical protein